MKILQVFPGRVWGGAEQFILDMGNTFENAYNEVRYMAYDESAVSSRLGREGISYSVIPSRWAFSSATVDAMASAMEDCDVVHIHDVSFAPAAVRARRKSGSKALIVMHRHDAHRTPANIFYRPYLKQIDRAVFVSDLARRCWHGANKWFPAEKCTVVLNSTPPERVRKVVSLREKYHIAPTTPLLIFCGRVKKTKGVHILLEALSRLADRDFALVIVGKAAKDSYLRKLRRIAERGGIIDRTFYFGYSDQARSFLREADIALAPSVGKESFALTNIEAMMAGACVVTTDNGGQTEYIEDGRTGLLVPPGAPAALADAIRKLLDNPDLRKRIAKAGKEYAEANMTYSNFIDKIMAVYTTKTP